MKPPSDLTLADIQKLIDSQEPESLVLEFKDSKALDKSGKKTDELSKDISAFANAAGGRIIYGVEEKKTGGIPHAHALSEGCNPAEITAEWLEQKINSNIHPRPQGVRIHTIRLDTGALIFAVDVPAATTFAPHQASDKRYYQRRNFSAEPLHHHEVMDLLRRASTPALFLTFETEQRSEGLQRRAHLYLRPSLGNRSAAVATSAIIEIILPHEMQVQAPSGFKPEPISLMGNAGEGPVLMTSHTFIIHPQTHLPVFKEHRFRLGEFRIELPLDGSPFPFGYRLSCPGFTSGVVESAFWLDDKTSKFVRVEQSWKSPRPEATPPA